MKAQEDLCKSCGIDVDATPYCKDEILNQQLQAVIAGSLRAPSRTYEARLADSAKCKHCPELKATLEHIIWHCPTWSNTRDKYVLAMEKYIEMIEKSDFDRGRRARSIIQLPCFRNCGVAPESQYFIQGGAQTPDDDIGLGERNSDMTDLTNEQKAALGYDQDGRVLAFTDGTAVCPDDPRRRRAAWGIHYAHQHPWNRNAPVAGPVQTVYRAELLAVLHAVKSATAPTRVVSDCQSVVEQLRDTLAGAPRKASGDHAELWEEMNNIIQGRPQGYYAVDWVASHADLDMADSIERAGGLPEGSHCRQPLCRQGSS